MITSLARTTNPTSWLAVTRDQMEEQLSRTPDYLGSKTDGTIAAATQWVQEHTQRSIVATGQAADQTYTMKLNAWPSNKENAIYLPYGPVSSISSFSYLDSAGTSTPLVADTGYKLNNNTGTSIPFVTPISGWPSLYGTDYRESITITYVVGESSVPEWAQTAILAYGTYIEELDSKYLMVAENSCRPKRIFFDWKLND